MSETKETVDRKSTEEFGLKPCPFCGKKQSEWSPDCACGNPALDSMTKGAWNRRPIEDALRARIAELEAERRWIPVSERLPECEKDVLVFWGKALDGSKIDWFGTAWRNDSDDGKWCTDPIVPTHWMPLPQPPEVQE